MLLHLPHIVRVRSGRGLTAYPARALLEADRESRSDHPSAEADRESRSADPSSEADRESRSVPPSTEADTASRTVRPSAEADRASRTVRPSAEADTASRTVRPSAEADRASRSAGSRPGACSPAPFDDSEPRTSASPAGSPVPTDSRTSSESRRNRIKSLSSVVQSIVARHPNGLLCSKLALEYKVVTGVELDVTVYGSHSVLDLVTQLPIKIIKSNAFGDWLLFTLSQPLPDFVNDETMADDGLVADRSGDAECLRLAKQRIRDILFSFPEGLRMSSLQDHYQMNCNEPLPFAKLGFASIEAFVLHLTGDVLQVKYTGDGLKLYPIRPQRPDQRAIGQLYPADAVGPGASFERVKLPELPLGDYNFEVYVAEVYHPHKFWFHLRGDEYAGALEKLMDEMDMVYYTSLGWKYRMSESTVQVGQVCAAPYMDQGYHRAVITGVRSVSEPVKVFYVDYGSVAPVDRAALRFLVEKFFRLPAQALLGRLANILPAEEASVWTPESAKSFLSLVNDNRLLYAMALERSPSCTSLCLCDTNGDTDVHINDKLVELGHACFQTNPMQLTHEAMEEVSRPVSVSPSSAAARAAAAPPKPPPPPPPPPPPEASDARSTSSDIDRLLQEMADSGAEAASSAPGQPRRDPSVSPSAAPGQPPGFSGSPQQPTVLPSPPPQPAISNPALSQMLTQSALLNNLQMMQLQSLMNPLMNPYAALLMSQACGSVPAVPGPSCASVPPVNISAVSTAPTDSVPGSSAAPGAAAAAAAGPPPARSSAGSSLQDGARAAASVPAGSATSCQGLDEAEIAQINRELGECATQTRFVKQIVVPDGAVHLVGLDGQGYLVSAEISLFLWPRDILQTMLLLKRMTLPCRSVDVENHQELFAELVRYNVPGVMDGDELVDPLTLYPITCVQDVFAAFKNAKSEHDLKAVIADVIAQFDPDDPYWTAPDDGGGDGPTAERSEPAGSSSDGGSGGVRPAGPPAASPPPDAADSADLLPEMCNILSQLKTKRRRKVEASMVALEGSGFSYEDVIGDDLRQLDAQIASFQRRIEALTGGEASSSSAEGSHRAGSNRSWCTMNPDAAEFVCPDEGSVYASVNSTLCDAEEAAEPPAAGRAPVELRAPDGTPVRLEELVSRAQSLQLGAPAVRRPVEVRTPDGRPLQLRGPAISTPVSASPELRQAAPLSPPSRAPPPASEEWTKKTSPSADGMQRTSSAPEGTPKLPPAANWTQPAAPSALPAPQLPAVYQQLAPYQQLTSYQQLPPYQQLAPYQQYVAAGGHFARPPLVYHQAVLPFPVGLPSAPYPAGGALQQYRGQ